jgi:hypothetical protein
MASGSPAGGQSFEKFDKHVLLVISDRPVSGEITDPFAQIFKIWSPGRAAGGKAN